MAIGASKGLIHKAFDFVVTKNKDNEFIIFPSD